MIVVKIFITLVYYINKLFCKSDTNISKTKEKTITTLLS